MRLTPERILIAAMAVFAVIGSVAVALHDIRLGAHDDPVPPSFLIEPAHGVATVVDPGQEAAHWFARVKARCNVLEVMDNLRRDPAPGHDQGTMYEAACYALAGEIDLARGAIQSLPPEARLEAAGVVFGVGHPAADAGDELAAGPLMELVVEYWPNHYMALYHAGAAAFERGESARARGYLERFLSEYGVDDGWRANAERMIAEASPSVGR